MNDQRKVVQPIMSDSFELLCEISNLVSAFRRTKDGVEVDLIIPEEDESVLDDMPLEAYAKLQAAKVWNESKNRILVRIYRRNGALLSLDRMYVEYTTFSYALNATESCAMILTLHFTNV